MALLLSACTVGPDFAKPAFLAPKTWSLLPANANWKTAGVPSRVVSEPFDPAWWERFGDPNLSSLIERAAKTNLSLRSATIRLAESRAQRGIAAADQFPALHGNVSYTRLRPSEKGVLSLGAGLFGGSQTQAASGVGSGTAANGIGIGALGIPAAELEPFSLWQYGFDASWELDLWGRVRRSVESAEANLEASAEARRDALVSVTAEVARDYVDLRRTQRSLAITRQILQAARENLALTRRREEAGLVSKLDIAEARTEFANIQAQIPQWQQQEAEAINRLSLLLGERPGALQKDLAQFLPIPPIPPRVPIGLPSELARRRPDVREAEARLHAATADIGVAVGDFYPRITLSGSAGFQALKFQDLGSWAARQYGLGPSLTLPIFEGGRLKATLEVREARHQEAAIAYHETVLRAWHEVDDALTAHADLQRRHARLAEAVESNRQALNLARQRYRHGVSTFLPVLDAQRALLQAEQEYVNSASAMSTNLVALYKALGGGWEEPEEAADAGRSAQKAR